MNRSDRINLIESTNSVNGSCQVILESIKTRTNLNWIRSLPSTISISVIEKKKWRVRTAMMQRFWLIRNNDLIWMTECSSMWDARTGAATAVVILHQISSGRKDCCWWRSCIVSRENTSDPSSDKLLPLVTRSPRCAIQDSPWFLRWSFSWLFCEIEICGFRLHLPFWRLNFGILWILPGLIRVLVWRLFDVLRSLVVYFQDRKWF